MGVKNQDLLDLIATTLSEYPEDTFEVMWDSQDFEFCRIYNEKSRKVDGGDKLIRNMVLDRVGNAKYRRLFDTDVPTVENVQKQIEVPWCQVGTDYSWDILEIKRNRSEKGFIDLLNSRRTERLWDFAELLEERGWKTPTNSTDDLYPYGIPYYLCMLDAGSTDGGFNGKTIRYEDGSNGTICANLDAGVYDKWRNYADTYTMIDNEFLRRLRLALLKTRFRPPQFVPTPGQDTPGTGMNKKIYVNSDQAVELMDLADKRDDASTPGDLAGKALVNGADGITRFNLLPVSYIPQLDDVTYSPIYCVDWTKLQPFAQDGYWMIEGEPMNDRGQHTTFTVFLDAAHNNLCINRRTAGFVMHTPIPA